MFLFVHFVFHRTSNSFTRTALLHQWPQPGYQLGGSLSYTTMPFLHATSTILPATSRATNASMDETDSEDGGPLDNTPCVDEAVGFPPTLNYARKRPKHIPKKRSQSYPRFKTTQFAAFRAAINHLEHELAARTAYSHITLRGSELTLHLHSQSKLSQQELGDLQKATHFDKKELQQWYKGMKVSGRHMKKCTDRLSSSRISQGLPIWHAHQGGVSKDLQAVLPIR